jgi:hypothetical protein
VCRRSRIYNEFDNSTGLLLEEHNFLFTSTELPSIPSTTGRPGIEAISEGTSSGNLDLNTLLGPRHLGVFSRLLIGRNRLLKY